LTAGQAVVWYTGQFYALFFLTQALKVDAQTANILIAVSLLIGTPFFLFFGWLSDRVGRKPIIMAGCLLAALTYFPLFKALTDAANPALAQAQRAVPITVTVDPARCSFQGSPIAREVDFRSDCDLAKRTLAQAAVNYSVAEGPAGTAATVKIGERIIAAPNATLAPGGYAFDTPSKARVDAFKKEVVQAARAAGYPPEADPERINKPLVVAILTLLVLYVTMVYGPIAAALVELFPTRIRYSSLSLPYHIGNGWFGGLLPTTAFAIVAQTGDIYNGLWYPILVAGVTFVVGTLFIRETKDRDIYAAD
jgi:MFS family permease